MPELRTPTTDDELDAAVALDELAFHERYDDAARARARADLGTLDAVGAWEGDELVGIAGSRDLSLTVPGGELACAGVTWVGVRATHRRRGVLRSMVGELLDRADAAGQPVAALFAAEGGIYGRYGFGVASRALALEVDARAPLELRVAPSEAPLRLLPAADELDAIRALHDELRPRRAGRPARTSTWWRTRTLLDEGEGARTARRVVVLGAPGEEEGYAIYQTTKAAYPSDRVRVVLRELEARTAAGEAALWRYLTSIDLADVVEAEPRPVDDLVLTLATDPDRVRVTRERPALWVRVVDLPATLAARAWATSLDFVLEVADGARPGNQGRWRVRPGSCEPAPDAEPDLALEVREVGALLLGGVRTRMLVDAGLVEERTPGAATALDAALAVPRAPFAPEYW